MLKILDCTLRDGGYYTNWDFPKEVVDEYLETVLELPIEYIEIGYRSPSKEQYFGQYFYLPIKTIQYIREKVGLSKKLALMINTKDCNSEELLESLLLDCKDYIDLVRFSVSPSNFLHSLKLARKTKSMGFEVALNIMYLSQMDISQINDFVGSITSTVPDVDFIYLVDSYGACYPNEVFEKIKTASEISSIPIGFHGHDNIQLAFANSLSAGEGGAKIVDSTITGMGRGAGNLSTELYCSYHCNYNGIEVDYTRLANLVESFNELKRQYGWGTSLPYMISGLEKLPQGEIMRLVSMKRYKTNTILSLLKNKNQTVEINDIKLFDGADSTLDNVVLVGGGNEVIRHIESILDLARRSKTVFIHASLKNLKYFLEEGITNIVCLPGDEVNKLEKEYHKEITYLLSEKQSNKRAEDIIKLKNCFVIDKTGIDSLFTNKDFSYDPPLLMCLKAAKKIGEQPILLTGFDGYEKETNANKLLREENQQIINIYNESQEKELISITPTKYNIKINSLYSILVNEEINKVK
ncbi:hypothetical protein [Cytobacillus firmus]|uniref:hypothetical protein n=1 Tax=Cytobacillus firmus TaxID=1399 RepID=UPI003001155A